MIKDILGRSFHMLDTFICGSWLMWTLHVFSFGFKTCEWLLREAPHLPVPIEKYWKVKLAEQDLQSG